MTRITKWVWYMLSSACVGNKVTGSKLWLQIDFGSFLNMFSKHNNHAVPLCSELPFSFMWITLIDYMMITYFYSCLPLTHSPHSSHTIFLKQNPCYIVFPLNCFNSCLILLRQRANPIPVLLEPGQFAWPSFSPTSPPRYSLCQQLWVNNFLFLESFLSCF